MPLVKFNPQMAARWQSIVDNSPYSPSPLGGPEYFATMNMGWGSTFILESGDFFIPFIKKTTAYFKILKSDAYQGLRFNSLPGYEHIDNDLLKSLPLNCALQLDLPEEIYLQARKELAQNHFIEGGHYQYYKVQLPASYEDWFMQKGMSRSNIRKAEKAGLTVSIGGVETLEEFYRMYLCSYVRWQKADRAKTPHPLERFRRMFEMPTSQTKIAHAIYDGKIISSVIFCHYKNTAGAFNSGTDFDYQKLRASDYLYSEIIRYLVKQGVKEFHLGGTLGGKNLSQFKLKLGATEYKSYILTRHRFPRLTNMLK